jgi:hypothetical protein
MDPGLRFWLRYVDDHGGLTEPATDGTLVVLPPAVAAEFDLPDELMVTSDPDIAREDGTVLLATGHPVLIRAADATLTSGDAGVVALAAPTTPAPGADYLQDRVREQFPVEHGRIDVTGLPTRVTRLVLRVGALVTYTVSAEECCQERDRREVPGPPRHPPVPAARRTGAGMAGAGRRSAGSTALSVRVRLAPRAGHLRQRRLSALRRGQPAVGEQDTARLRGLPARCGPARRAHLGVRPAATRPITHPLGRSRYRSRPTGSSPTWSPQRFSTRVPGVRLGAEQTLRRIGTAEP